MHPTYWDSYNFYFATHHVWKETNKFIMPAADAADRLLRFDASIHSEYDGFEGNTMWDAMVFRFLREVERQNKHCSSVQDIMSHLQIDQNRVGSIHLVAITS